MEIVIFKNYNDLSHQARNIIIRQLREKDNSLFCASTGNSPKRTYELLVEDYKDDPGLFSRLRIIKLDEWGGVPINDPHTCESYLHKHLVGPLNITETRYFSFSSDPLDPDLECKRIQKILDEKAPIDLCILGLGLNGHIAFNEPDEYLLPNCHIAKLTRKSMGHPMSTGMGKEPSYGLTLGMADILQSRKIIILITGSAKKAITKEFLSGKMTTSVPASWLWLHSNVTCLIEEDVML